MTSWKCFNTHYRPFLFIIGEEYRLQDGNAWYGRVEVLVNGEWGALCDSDYWGPDDASAVCVMLGYALGEVWYDTMPPVTNSKIWHTRFSCPSGSDAVPVEACIREPWYSTYVGNAEHDGNFSASDIYYPNMYAGGCYSFAAVVCYGTGNVAHIMTISCSNSMSCSFH